MFKRQRVLWLVLGVVAASLVFGNGGFRRWVALSQQKRLLLRELRRLQADREVLTKELQQAKEDPRYLEYRARRDLGMVKKGEGESRFPPPAKKKAE